MDSENRQVLKKWLIYAWYVCAPILIFGYFFNELMLNAFWENKSLLFFSLAAILNAVMDCVESEHIKITIFKSLNENFWYKRVSCEKAINVGKYKLDAWHLAKSGMIICFVFAIIFYVPMFGFWIDFLMFGLWWNHVFNGFYNHIFSTK